MMDYEMLGAMGRDCGIRALFCYLMAETA
jgi:hypothetical protein